MQPPSVYYQLQFFGGSVDTAINVGLLLLGFVGAIAAIGGDTWRKGENSVLQRITRRGWVSIIALMLALTLGVAKEFRLRSATVAFEHSVTSLQDQLKTATNHLEAAEKSRTELSAKLVRAQRSLAALEPNILEGMFALTERIPREQDFAFVQFRGRIEEMPISSETDEQLQLYGGDIFDYTVFCDQFPHRSELFLKTSTRRYRLRAEHDEIRISGPIGTALRATISNPNRLRDCGMKIIITSTDRTRTIQQFDEFLEKIGDAKEALE